MKSRECRVELVKIFNRLPSHRDVICVHAEFTPTDGNFFGKWQSFVCNGHAVSRCEPRTCLHTFVWTVDRSVCVGMWCAVFAVAGSTPGQVDDAKYVRKFLPDPIHATLAFQDDWAGNLAIIKGKVNDRFRVRSIKETNLDDGYQGYSPNAAGALLSLLLRHCSLCWLH